MIIAVMSDLHDNITNWGLIQNILAEKNITTLINCGDTCAPAMLKEMSKMFDGQIHTVFGNVADRALETEVVKTLANVTHYGDHGEIVLEHKKVFFNHFPLVAEQAAASSEYDLACHGHTHLKRWEKMSKTLILNPGTAGGMFQYPSFATVDLATLTHEFIDITL